MSTQDAASVVASEEIFDVCSGVNEEEKEEEEEMDVDDRVNGAAIDAESEGELRDVDEREVFVRKDWRSSEGGCAVGWLPGNGENARLLPIPNGYALCAVKDEVENEEEDEEESEEEEKGDATIDSENELRRELELFCVCIFSFLNPNAVAGRCCDAGIGRDGRAIEGCCVEESVFLSLGDDSSGANDATDERNLLLSKSLLFRNAAAVDGRTGSAILERVRAKGERTAECTPSEEETESLPVLYCRRSGSSNVKMLRSFAVLIPRAMSIFSLQLCVSAVLSDEECDIESVSSAACAALAISSFKRIACSRSSSLTSSLSSISSPVRYPSVRSR